MAIYEKIQEERNRCRKIKDEKVTYNLLTTLYSDIKNLEKDRKEINDASVITILKKYEKNLNENLKYLEGDPTLTTELNVIKSFLPTQLTGNELKVAIENAIAAISATNIKEMGKVMGELKKAYPGRFDGQEAGNLIKEVLNG